MRKKVITRFAPSPTGYLHIGGLRTALFSFLTARKHTGLFRLRIEDTDQKREIAGATEHLVHILARCGLGPDGEIVVQSDNVKKGIYRAAAEKLVAKRHAYLCYCTEERLTELREEQARKKLPPRYDGLCRNLTEEQIAAHQAAGRTPVIRIRIPDTPAALEAIDGIHGKLSFETATLTDAVLLKSDGFPTYHLANVVDDHDMQITHVIRGEEWIPSLPLHLLLYEFLGYEAPAFYHLPLILNADRSKLSKRQGHVSVDWYLGQGYLKEAIINYVAFLGWNPGDEREIFSLDELVKEFDLAKLNRAGAVFSLDKLNWYNSWYIKNSLAPKNPKELSAALEPFLPGEAPERRLAIFNVFFERIHYLSELSTLWAELKDIPDYKSSLLIFKKSTKDKTRKGLDAAFGFFEQHSDPWTALTLELELKKLTQDSSLLFGDVFWPLRVALSGAEASPPPSELAVLLGKQETLSRIRRARTKLEG